MLTQLITKIFTGEAGLFITRLRAVAAIYAVMAALAMGLVFFLLLAIFIFTAQRLGPITASLLFAFVWLLLLLAAYVALVMARRPPKQRANDRLQRDIASVASVAAISNLPLIVRSLRRRRSLLLVPIAAFGAWGIARGIRGARSWRD
ncbi:hypothetical protein [Aureimonas sp. AU4]|uniref:hypothetical protein n=1 Tax=Aureimonas sp. AU4 TaxID=1638163 RepID=UPI0007816613|nr:hypothetical protein [Aureimonas sp. AU4]